jgi:putative ABC transport system permease protein
LEVVVGSRVAKDLGLVPGDTFEIMRHGTARKARVTGIVETFGRRNHSLFAPLSAKPSQVLTSLELRALTTQEESVYRRLNVKPSELPKKDFERWFCTPFLSSITYNLQETFKEFWVFPVRPNVLLEERLFARTKRLCSVALWMSVIFSLLALWSVLSVTLVAHRSHHALFFLLGGGFGKSFVLYLCELFSLLIPTYVFGALVGMVLSYGVSKQVLGMEIMFSWELLLLNGFGLVGLAVDLSSVHLGWQKLRMSGGELKIFQEGSLG